MAIVEDVMIDGSQTTSSIRRWRQAGLIELLKAERLHVAHVLMRPLLHLRRQMSRLETR